MDEKRRASGRARISKRRLVNMTCREEKGKELIFVGDPLWAILHGTNLRAGFVVYYDSSPARIISSRRLSGLPKIVQIDLVAAGFPSGRLY